MVSKRLISKTVSTSRKLSRVSDFSALLFTWIIPHCDDFGHFERSPEMVKAIVVPLRNKTVDEIEMALKELEDSELIVKYISSDVPYLEITQWYNFQSFKNYHQLIAQYPMPPWSSDKGQSELLDVPPITPSTDNNIYNNNININSSEVSLTKKDSLYNRGNSPSNDMLNQIYDTYKEKISKATRFTVAARAKVKSRLQSYSINDLLLAIDNFSQNSWWMEHNGDNGMAWFFSSDNRIDMFLSLNSQKGKEKGTINI